MSFTSEVIEVVGGIPKITFTRNVVSWIGNSQIKLYYDIKKSTGTSFSVGVYSIANAIAMTSFITNLSLYCTILLNPI